MPPMPFGGALRDVVSVLPYHRGHEGVIFVVGCDEGGRVCLLREEVTQQIRSKSRDVPPASPSISPSHWVKYTFISLFIYIFSLSSHLHIKNYVRDVYLITMCSTVLCGLM